MSDAIHQAYLSGTYQEALVRAHFDLCAMLKIMRCWIGEAVSDADKKALRILESDIIAARERIERHIGRMSDGNPD